MKNASGLAELRIDQLQLPNPSALFDHTRGRRRGLDGLQAEPAADTYST